jgi:hypothetical protein
MKSISANQCYGNNPNVQNSSFMELTEELSYSGSFDRNLVFNQLNAD